MTVKVITTIDQWQAFRVSNLNKSVGFVPTMGYLHEGHKSLIRRAKEENDIAVVSIFVNPLQFGPNEDLDRYPRDLERDTVLADEANCDIIFAPSTGEMYPGEMYTKVIVNGVTEKLCGASRPGHFDGVATVVTKLLHIINPSSVYFGMKDAQQVAVVEQLVKDLNFPVKVVRCTTIRETDGLAMSSRNVYLSADEREEARLLSQALDYVKEAWEQGVKDISTLKEMAVGHISRSSLAKIDYIEILSYPDLQYRSYDPNQTFILALAVFFGKTRLIDNVLLETNVTS